MTLISDVTYKKHIASGLIGVYDYLPENCQPASIDVRLMSDIKQIYYNPAYPETNLDNWYDLNDSPAYEIQRGDFVLGSTIESISLPLNYAARFEGKSTLARQGLVVHSTAGFIDPGFTGQITLEMSMASPRPLLLSPGMKIGQICFYRMDRAASEGYGHKKFGSKYQGQRGPTSARPEVSV